MRHTTTVRPTKLTGPTTVIILAAEHVGRPNKSLYKLNGETILDSQIRTLRKIFPVCEIIAITGYDGDRILDYPIKVVENERFEETNAVRDICLALRVASYQNLLILNNNIYFNEAAVDIFSHESRVLVKSGKNRTDVGCVVQGNVLNFVYGMDPRWEEITFISYKDMPIFRDFCANRRNEKMFLHEALNKLVNRIQILPIEPQNAEVIKYELPRHISERGTGINQELAAD